MRSTLIKLLAVAALGLALARPPKPGGHGPGGRPPTPRPPAQGFKSGKENVKADYDDAEADSAGSSGSSSTPDDSGNPIDPRDIHGTFRDAHREVDVDRVWSEGDLYFQGGLMVKVLSNGDGTYQVVIRDPSNMSGAPVTVMEAFTQNALDQRISSGEWEDYS